MTTHQSSLRAWASQDTCLCTRSFNEAEVTRHFAAANAQQALADSGSADRHARVAGVKKRKLPWDPIKEAIANRLKRETPPADAQLNLFEFVNFLVRVAFWRANPQHGSKYNKKDLTPVPEAVAILLDGFLPRAKRDTSHLFREKLADDLTTQVHSHLLPAATLSYRQRPTVPSPPWGAHLFTPDAPLNTLCPFTGGARRVP